MTGYRIVLIEQDGTESLPTLDTFSGDIDTIHMVARYYLARSPWEPIGYWLEPTDMDGVAIWYDADEPWLEKTMPDGPADPTWKPPDMVELLE